MIAAAPVSSQRPLARGIARSTAAQAGLMLGGALLSLLALRVASRQLGPERYGAVAAALALVTLLSVGADLGLGVVGAREAARRPGEGGRVVVSLAILRGLLGIALAPVAIGMGAALYGVHSDSFTAVMVLSPALPLLAVQAALGALFIARGRNALNVAVQALGALALLGGALAIAAGGLGTTAYALAVLGSEGVAVLAVAALFLVQRPEALRPLPLDATWALVVQALPLALVQVLNVVYLRIDVVMLGAMRPAAEVGQYSVAYQVIALVMALPSLFMTALLPAVATADPGRTRALLQRALEVSATAAMPIVLVVAAAAPVIIDAVSQARFEPGARALQVLAVGAALSYGSAVYGNVLIARGLQRRLVRVTVAVVAVNVVLNLALIPVWGTTGAACAMAASEAAALLLSARAGNRALELRPRWAPLLPPLGAGAVAGVLAAVLWRTPMGAHDLPSAALDSALLLLAFGAALASLGGLHPFRGLRIRDAAS